jgi:hypothetical protein
MFHFAPDDFAFHTAPFTPISNLKPKNCMGIKSWSKVCLFEYFYGPLYIKMEFLIRNFLKMPQSNFFLNFLNFSRYLSNKVLKMQKASKIPACHISTLRMHPTSYLLISTFHFLLSVPSLANQVEIDMKNNKNKLSTKRTDIYRLHFCLEKLFFFAFSPRRHDDVFI